MHSVRRTKKKTKLSPDWQTIY